MSKFIVAVLIVAGMAGSAAAAPGEKLGKDRVLFILAEGFNRGEFWTPYLALKAAGYKVDVAAPARGTVPLNADKPNPQDATADLTLDEVKMADYAGLVIPGGYSPGNLEKLPRAIEICREFMLADKPVAAICHGPRLLMRGGLAKGRVLTCLYKVKDELADPWTKGDYGAYVDEPVVIDGNLLTSRYPNDAAPFAAGILRQLAAAGGLPVPVGSARAIIVANGLDGNQKWTLTEIPALLGVKVTLLDAKGVAALAADASFDAASVDLLLVLDGPDFASLGQDKAFAQLARRCKEAGAALSAANEAEKVFREAGVEGAKAFEGSMPEFLRQTVLLSHAAAQRHKATPPAAPADAAIILTIEKGFSLPRYAAVRLFLEAQGRRVVVAGASPGWIRSAEGVPVRAEVVSPSPDTADVLSISGERISGRSLPEGLAEFMGRAFAPLPAGAQYTAAIALGEGFDDLAYTMMKLALRARGYRTLIVGPAVGPLKGLNGLIATVGAGYDEKVALAADAVIVAPGRFWPGKAQVRQAAQPDWIEQQDARDTARLNWLQARYDAGATLVLLGLDSLAMGSRPAFKGLKFASSDQAVWSFPKEAGKFSSAPAERSAPRLISGKGSAAVTDVLKLLDEPTR